MSATVRALRRRLAGLSIWTVVLTITLIVIAVLLINPLAKILMASFIDRNDGTFTLANYQRILGLRFYRTALLNSLTVGVGGMVGALVLGVPLAFLTSRFTIRGRSIIATLAVLALVSPPFIGAYSWIMMLGANGWLRHMLNSVGIGLPSVFGVFGILLVFTLKFYPFVFLLTASALSSVNRSLEDAAENLGCGPYRRFFKVTLPLVFPAVSAGALLAFVLSVADFGTPQIIGGEFRVLSTEAYNLFTSEIGGNPGLASTVSIILISISLIFIILQRQAVNRRNYAGNLINRPEVKKLVGVKQIVAHVICYTIVIASSIPSIVVIFMSFRKTRGPVFHPGFSLSSYERIIREVPDVITNSFMFSISAVVLIVTLGTLVGYILARRQSLLSGTLDSVLMIPYIVPGVVLGIGFIVAFNTGPLTMTGTGIIIILVIFIRRLPYSVRSSVSILKQISHSLEEAAISLGAPPGRAFARVTLPLMLPGIVAGAMMAFVTAINELSSSIILYVGGTMTMPVRIYLSVLDGEFGTAAALSTILLVTTGIAVYFVFRYSSNKENAFV
ncbi:MAG: ABC transporter permease [Alphaproteobacteria bacterium]